MSPRRIRTALYGDQSIESTELDLLHTPALQRLYELHQLGLADRVFVDASHSRLHHVLGVLEQVDNIVSAISENLERDSSGRSLGYATDGYGGTASSTPQELASYVQKRRKAARVMGLLHDLTHAPFGHTLEDEVQLYPEKHDEPARQADAFFRLLVQYIAWIVRDVQTSRDAEGIRELLDGRAIAWEEIEEFLGGSGSGPIPSQPESEELLISLGVELCGNDYESRRMTRSPDAKELEGFFGDMLFAMRALLWLDAVHHPELIDPSGTYAPAAGQAAGVGGFAFERVLSGILSGRPCGATGTEVEIARDAFLLDVIGNTICADLLDYAKRDAHYAGLRLDYDVDRIVENFTVVSHRSKPPVSKSPEKPSMPLMLRTAIGVFSHKYRVDMPGELMNLLQVRFFVYQRVLYHQTKSIAGAMLGSALQLLGFERSIPTRYRFVGDDVFLSEMRETTRLLLSVLKEGRTRGVRSPAECLSLLGLSESAIHTIAASDNCRQILSAGRAEDAVVNALTVSELTLRAQAALRLLERLGARRYHRAVFRLLPNVDSGKLNLDAAHIASVFLNARVRANAERAIEALSNLPAGAIAIHCPRGDGPRKIAEILVWGNRGSGQQAYQLRDVAKVDPEVFQKHQEAIQAVEGMYASMWRLVVSVAPEHLPEYARIGENASTVISAILAGLEVSPNGAFPHALREDERVTNDRRMIEELARSRAAPADLDDSVVLRFPDGHRERMTVSRLAVAVAASDRLIALHPQVQDLVHASGLAASTPSDSTASLAALLEGFIPPPKPKATEKGGDLFGDA